METSFGAARLARVGGAARAKVDHGGVSAEDVTGGLNVESSYENVDVARIGGPLEVSVHHGQVDAKGAAQGARVRGSGGDVEIDGVSGTIDVEVERGSARIHPRAAIAAPVTVTVRNGEAQLTLPDGQPRRGRRRSRRAARCTPTSTGSRPPPSRRGHRGERLSGKLGGGGSLVKVSADGDVTLDAASAAAIAEQPIAKPSLATDTATPAAERPAAEARPGAESPAASRGAPDTAEAEGDACGPGRTRTAAAISEGAQHHCGRVHATRPRVRFSACLAKAASGRLPPSERRSAWLTSEWPRRERSRKTRTRPDEHRQRHEAPAPDEPARRAALAARQGARRVRPRRPPAGGGDRPAERVRRRAADRHPRQGRRADADVAVLVLAAAGRRSRTT